MVQKLKISFDDPEFGWVRINIDSGMFHIYEQLSYISDPFDHIVAALGACTTRYCSVTVECELEPGQLMFSFHGDGGLIRLTISERHRHTKRLFEVKGTFDEICLPFWRALRNLQGRFSDDELSSRMHKPFPSSEMKNLTQKVELLRGR